MPQGKLVTRVVQALVALALAEVFVFWTVATVLPGCVSNTNPTEMEDTDPSETDPVASTDVPQTDVPGETDPGETDPPTDAEGLPDLIVNYNPNPCVVAMGESCTQNACQSKNVDQFDNSCGKLSSTPPTKNCRQECVFDEPGVSMMESCARNEAGQVCRSAQAIVMDADEDLPPPQDTTDLPTTDIPTTDTPTTTTTTIPAVPSTVIITTVDSSVGEPNNNGRVRVSRSGGDTAVPLTVQLTVVGSATEGVDYQDVPNSVTIPAGATSVDIDIFVIDDAIDEMSESIVIILNMSTSYIVGASNATSFTISDNDP